LDQSAGPCPAIIYNKIDLVGRPGNLPLTAALLLHRYSPENIAIFSHPANFHILLTFTSC